MNISEKIQDLKIDLQAWYDEFMWKNSPERKELAHNRLIAHEKAMKEGRNSPYTHPEEYDDFF
jgi:hypothetical protein